MFGRVTIYVDSEVATSFQGDLDQWKYREKFKVPHIGPKQVSVEETPEPQLVPHKTITLKVSANLVGFIDGVPYLCLFCYNYDNPTVKQEWLDVNMARGQMRNLL